ncbi:hypothetical protein OF83DRAFT_1084354 [Amylostereum chailletii]|nr:hypothetical protein OF83DRAFT_1084354 [Amylostereum chailletii]
MYARWFWSAAVRFGATPPVPSEDTPEVKFGSGLGGRGRDTGDGLSVGETTVTDGAMPVRVSMHSTRPGAELGLRDDDSWGSDEVDGRGEKVLPEKVRGHSRCFKWVTVLYSALQQEGRDGLLEVPAARQRMQTNATRNDVKTLNLKEKELW